MGLGSGFLLKGRQGDFKQVFFIKFSSIPNNLTFLNQSYDNVALTTAPINEYNTANSLILVLAKTRISTLAISDDGEIATPITERKSCEKTLETAATVLAVCNGVSKEIYTPSGDLIAIEPETAEEAELLSQANRFDSFEPQLNLYGLPPATAFDWYSAIKDRQEGLTLMSDALNQNSASGQLRDLMRLFENAFDSPTKEIRKKIIQFLNPTMGYTSDEINLWIRLRDGLSHADKKKTGVIYYEADAAPHLNRIKQAAYDVLLNKANWNNRSSNCRNLWTPSVYTNNAAGHAVLTPGATVGFSMLDPFNVYKTWLGSGISNLPPEWKRYTTQKAD